MKKLVLMALVILLSSFLLMPVNILLADSPRFSMSYNGYQICDYPRTYGNIRFSIYANYQHGYGMWYVYEDDYSVTALNAREGYTPYSHWQTLPDTTKYYNFGSLALTTSNRINYPVLIGSSDQLLCANLANFSIYLPENNSSGQVYGTAYFYYYGSGPYWIDANHVEVDIYF